jgi:DNA helicase II / ATP-dependent DNA helicase PcrA
MSSNESIPFGVRLSDGRSVSVDEVERGAKCACICRNCRQPLIAKKGEKICHFFAHDAKYEHCHGGAEKAALLGFFHQYLTDGGTVRLPVDCADYAGRTQEVIPAQVTAFTTIEILHEDKWKDQAFRCKTAEGFELILTGGKRKQYREFGLPVLWIDLDQFLNRGDDPELTREFLHYLKAPNCTWDFSPKREEAIAQLKAAEEAHQRALKEEQERKLAVIMEAEKKNAELEALKYEDGNDLFSTASRQEAPRPSAPRRQQAPVAPRPPRRVVPIDTLSPLFQPMASTLNDEQYAAVTAGDGPALVVAAAGTGKTRTLTYRLAYLVLEKYVQPWEVLLLTFTNKAAREMIQRAEELIQRPFDRSYSGTFHSFANRLLRSHADSVGFGRDFSILDSDDAKKLVRACIDELKIEKKHFPKPEVLQSLWGVTSGRMGNLQEAVESTFEFSEVEPAKVMQVYHLYQERKKGQNAMDFDDLLLYALKVLEQNDNIRAYYQDLFKYVLVDEYQDTNAIQAKLVNLLVCEHGNIMVVGDDFQSIYSWRGADYRNFLDFEKEYRGAETYKLQTNYRSTPEILEVANAVIAGNPEQFQKTLHPVRPHGAGVKLALMRDGTSQARYIIQEVRDAHRNGTPLSDICVLYRSHFHAMELQMELAKAQLPYVVTSGVRFFEQAHIKDVCCVLRLLVNQSDELAFGRLTEMLPKVGPKTALKIFRKFGGRLNLTLRETHEKLIPQLPAAARDDWETKFMPLFLAYREENLSNDPGEVIFRFSKAFYSDYMIENFDNHKYRAEDIDGLIDFTVKFDSTEAFLSEVALMTNLDTETAAQQQEVDSLRLSTVHQAKGLEWKAIFVLFACEDMFPSKKTVEETGDAEERRLFYVAVTRAEDQLYLCVPQTRRQHDGGLIFLNASRFITEIPEELRTEERFYG